MDITQNSFEIKRCGEEYLDDILAIQEEAFMNLQCADWLRKNSAEMLRACLNEPHVTLGAFDGKTMAAFIILYLGEKTDENLGYSLGYVDDELSYIANFKLVIVKSAYRGNHLQYLLMNEIEKISCKKGIKLICTTVHPDNTFSRDNIIKSGYVWAKHFSDKYGSGPRELYIKELENGFYNQVLLDCKNHSLVL